RRVRTSWGKPKYSKGVSGFQTDDPPSNGNAHSCANLQQRVEKRCIKGSFAGDLWGLSALFPPTSMMQDPGREEAASSSASSSATPIQSVEQPAPLCSGPAAMAQMGVVASHQHPGAPALGPGPTASAFYGMPFAGPPRQPTPAASQAGPSGGFQGPSYAGHVHCSPAALAGPSGAGFQGPPYAGQVQYSSGAQAGYHGVLYAGQHAQTAACTSGPMYQMPSTGFSAFNAPAQYGHFAPLHHQVILPQLMNSVAFASPEGTAGKRRPGRPPGSKNKSSAGTKHMRVESDADPAVIARPEIPEEQECDKDIPRRDEDCCCRCALYQGFFVVLPCGHYGLCRDCVIAERRQAVTENRPDFCPCGGVVGMYRRAFKVGALDCS
ncbi:Sodium/potassium/calcium exchanger 1, partial [Frankliniella fusca]